MRWLLAQCPRVHRTRPSSAFFSSSSTASMPRRRAIDTTATAGPSTEDVLAGLDLDFEDDDTSSLGHLMLRQQRQTLHYLRLIEHEMPKLVAYRKPFIPPTSATPLIVRMVDYAGEEHPATVKRSVVVPVGQLPLEGDDAVHKIKLLAGPRWTPDPPSDSGVGPDEPDREHGYIKISCEDFPKPAMNLKWASDALDRLIAEANNPENKFGHLPIDTRHVIAKARKAKKGEHIRNRVGRRASLRDFPEEWLPTLEETPDPPSGR